MGGLFILFVFLLASLPLCVEAAFLKRSEFAEKCKKKRSFFYRREINNHMSAKAGYNDQYQLSVLLFEQVLRLLPSERCEEVAKAAAHSC